MIAVENSNHNMSDWGDHDNDDVGVVSSGDDDDDEQSLSNMFYNAKKTKGISEDSYADWQAIVSTECESHHGRNFSFKASKRIFRIELARGDFATAKTTEAAEVATVELILFLPCS